MSRKRKSASQRAICEEVRFMEVEYPRLVQPRLVIRFSDGLSILVENEDAIPLAGEFIAAYRAHEQKKGGRR